jgi:hypothetical protein
MEFSDIPDSGRMPWKETDALSERARFALEWKRRWEATEGERVEMAELCRVFGVSRQRDTSG